MAAPIEAFVSKIEALSSPTQKVLTVIEVAKELRCSKAHVHNLINGEVPGTSPLPALCLGRRRVVRRETLNLWIETNERTGAAL